MKLTLLGKGMERCLLQTRCTVLARLLIARCTHGVYAHSFQNKFHYSKLNQESERDYNIRSLNFYRQPLLVRSFNRMCLGLIPTVYSASLCSSSQVILFSTINRGLPQSSSDIYPFKSLRTQLHSGKCLTDPSDTADSDSDKEDSNLQPALEALTPNTAPPHSVSIVPGKGPPPEPPVDCCMSGCANCVWIQYCEELKHYFSDGVGQELAKDAIESIENPGLKMFLKVELGFL